MSQETSNTALVARIRTLEGPDGIHIGPEPVPHPGPGEVLLDVRALGLNRAESMFSRGQYLVEAKLPSRIGVEGVGTVRAFGDDVHGLEIGQRVAAMGALAIQRYGLAGEVALVDQSMLLPDLPAMSDAELAAFWLAHITAYGGLVQEAQLQPGETALISAASSSAGLAAIQVAKRAGARVVATTRTGEKAEALRRAGADRVIATDERSVADSGEKLDVAFDAVAGSFATDLGPCMNPGGRIVLYGLLSGNPDTVFPLFAAFASNLRMSGFHAGFHLLAHSDRRARAIDWLTGAVRDGALTPTVDRVFALADLADAYRHLEGSTQVGKVVVEVAG